MKNIDELKKAHKRVTKMLDDASKINKVNELDLDSFGVNINFQLNKNNSNNLFISILDYNGYSIIELTAEGIKELKKCVSKL